MKRLHVILPVMTAVVIGLGSQAFAQTVQSSSSATTTPASDPWSNARTPNVGSSMANPGTPPTSSKTASAPAGTAQTPQDQKRSERKTQRMAERTAARNTCRDQAKEKSIPHDGMRDFMKTCRTTTH